MPRIEFEGQGQPIPQLALPPFGSDSDLPPTVLTFLDDADFLVDQYRELGFTHFEAWCIGGAGGPGGGVLTGDSNDPSYVNGIMPSTSYGGEGGGGGMHKKSGLLDDLPSPTHIVVGKAGAAGQNGNRHYRWLMASAMKSSGPGFPPSMQLVIKGDTNIPFMTDGVGNAIPPYFFAPEVPPNMASAYLYYANPYYVAPQDGTDGTATIFGDALAVASGGKGGLKTPVYRNSFSDTDRYSIAAEKGPGGNGGQGGTGGSALAGGGGDGSTASQPPEFFDTPGEAYPPGYNYRDEKPRIFVAAKDGTWDGTIGQGGGGGRGGTSRNNPTNVQTGVTPPPTVVPATAGGRGSFSYGDTSVYGQRGSVGTMDLAPGTAGGARALGSQKFGSRTANYNPNGIVVIRLTRIV